MRKGRLRRREFLKLAAAVPALRAPGQSQVPARRGPPDYVVIGGDPAAYALVHRLMTDDAVTVTLVDESPSFGRFVSGMPEPPRPLADAAPFVRGHRLCFDGWRDRGNPGWGYDDVLPFFKREERHDAGASEFRGGSGPLAASYCLDPHPAHRAFLVACALNGYRSDARYDFNGPTPQGVAGFYQKNMVDDREQTPIAAFLGPIRSRAGIELRPVTRVVRVILERHRAVGVEVVLNGAREVIRATREVIVGADPGRAVQILMLSGIGPAARLQAHGIDVVADVAGVGENLHDHVRLPVRWRTAAALPASSVTAGMFTVSLSTTPPDLQMDFAASAGGRPLMGIDVTLVRPQSRGRVTLASADPTAAPVIDTAALTSDVDVTALVQGVRLARLIATSTLLDPWRGTEVPDSAQRITTPDLERFVRQSVAPRGHLAGTCRMGPAGDPMAVVDPSLRVRGVEGLRVAGAAVMPDIVNAPPRAAAVMIGDRCADVALTSPTRG